MSSSASVRRPRCRRIDAADLELVSVLAADTDPHHQATRRHRGERGDLPSGDHRVTQGEQEDPGVQTQPRFDTRQCRQMHQHVVTRPAPEADVIGHEDVIDPGVGDVAELDPSSFGVRFEQVPGRADADAVCSVVVTATL